MTIAAPAPVPGDCAAGQTVAMAMRGAPLIPLESRILACHALGLTRVQLITQSERLLDGAEAARLTALFRRRLAGEPIAYLIGAREFFGLDFETTPAVLIPRPETELLVELALERLPAGGALLDLGTGSGAIAVAIAHARADAAVCALDASKAALEVATRNAARLLGARATPLELLLSDWYSALPPARRFDVIAANPPYVAAGDRHLQEGDLRFEPADALTDHGDGLGALRIIVSGAAAHLNSAGWLLMEHGYDQAASVRVLLAAAGFADVRSWHDLAGIQRVSGGRLA